jgi:protocatechuate 3,4-dioxygenase beta subunit
MAAVSAKKIGIGTIIAAFLLLGVGLFVADPFHLRHRREAKLVSAPAAPSTPPAASHETSPSPAAKTNAPNAGDREPVPPRGSILVRTVWEDDQLPVPGLLACVIREHELRRETTDERGEARFGRILEGGARVYLQRGSATFGGREVGVQAGRESEVTIEVPPGIEIEGIVVDGDGKPVPAASIWLTERQNSFQGAAVTAAGPDGKFRLRHVELGCYLGARAPGFAPSLLQSVDGRPTSVVPMRLVLDQPGVAVNGVVLDPDGNPVAEATVKIEKPSRGLRWTRDGAEMRLAALSGRTGEDGAFAFDCVAVGDLTLTVRSPGLVPFEAPLSVPGEGLSDLRIDLEEGVTVAGAVWTPEGGPAGGALVVVGTSDTNLAHLSGDLITIAASAEEDGSYRLVGVKPGEFEVRADGHGKGKASARLTGQAGEEVRWDAQLTLGLEILGRVVDESGKPVGKALVGAEGKGCVHAWIWTDREGRFRFSNCKEVPHKLAVRVGESPPSAEQEEVMPGKGEVALVLRAAARPSAFLIGKVLDPEGMPAETAHLVMSGLETKYPEKDGSFRIGPLSPGRYRLEVKLGEHPHLSRQGELIANETADLGTIQVHRGGRLQASLRKPDGTPCPASIRVVSVAGDSELEMKYSPEWVASSDLAAPGDYGILVWRRGLASTWVPVSVEDGQTASAEVVIRDGVERAFRLWSTEGKSGESIHVIVRGEDGNKVFDWRVQPNSGWEPSPDGVGRTLKLTVWLAPAMSYTAEASSRDRRAQASFVVADSAEAADPIVLDVH